MMRSLVCLTLLVALAACSPVRTAVKVPVKAAKTVVKTAL